MADRKPLKLGTDGATITQFQTGDTVPIANGGTGGDNVVAARINLGLQYGVDVQPWDADLDALAALSATAGMLSRTGANAFAVRTLAVDAGELTITNGDGAAGAPTFGLASVANGGGGTFNKVTVDGFGRVSGYSAVAAGDITALVDATYVNVAGDSMTNFLTLHADPSSALHAATKQYVDAISAGQRVKNSVRLATATAGTLASTFENGDLVDGVALVTGDRVLIKNQAAGAENGVYTVNASGAPTRATDFDSATGEIVGGATFWVNEGTTQADTAWTLTNDGPIVVGTTALVFTQSSGLGQVVAGNGMTKTGNTLNVGTASATRIVVNADDIDLATVTDSATGTFLKMTRDGYGRVSGTTAVVAADISALLDTDLTAIANNSTNGIYARTGTGTVAARTIVGATRIVVTNGDGVANNPSLDLQSGVVAPGTYNSVTVDTYGRVTSGTTSSSATITDSFTNGNAGAIVIGRAVYVSGADTVNLANANAAGTTVVVGLVATTTIASAAAGAIANAGFLAATTGQWDAVTGQTGGLTPGATYYLSNATAGALTTTAPASGYVVKVGVAMSTTKMAINIGPVIQL